ncbi:MAG: alpha/beta fold hydrolase [Bacteroidota bacterium]
MHIQLPKPSMSIKPPTQYTKSGSINIAYQVFGSGPIDLVYIPGWVSNIDWMWACPELVDFLLELGKMARVILFDKRGTGLSDRVVELSTLEERMDDIRAVMDAVGSEKAALFGHSEGGSVSALFAATYPNRTVALITFGIFAKRSYSPDYPWAPTPEERQVVYDMIVNGWGTGKMNLESLAPSKAQDKTFMDWLANYFRSGASPSAALVLTKMNTEVDIINILSSIRVPTLIMQRKDDIDVKIEEGRFIADRIAGAKFIELAGDDHLFWVGDTQRILAEIKSFVGQVRPIDRYEERLFTIVMARAASADTVSASYRELIEGFVRRYRGSMRRYDPYSFIATFDGPSRAAHCSLDLLAELARVGAQLTVGIHITAATEGQSLAISQQTAYLLESMQKQATPNQVLVTQTVKNLLSGAGLSFSAHSTIFDVKFGESLSLFSVSDQSAEEIAGEDELYLASSPNNTFLENVLQCINAHLDDPAFGVEMLCREIGVSERQLQRKLNAITNKSPNQMISSVRLHRAKELILKQADNIAEIAFQTGFSSPSYFAKCFKKEFGLSPSRFKENREI